MNITATTNVPATVYLASLTDHTAKGFGNTDTATAYYASFNSAIAPGGVDPTTNNSRPYGVITVNNS